MNEHAGISKLSKEYSCSKAEALDLQTQAICTPLQ